MNEINIINNDHSYSKSVKVRDYLIIGCDKGKGKIEVLTNAEPDTILLMLMPLLDKFLDDKFLDDLDDLEAKCVMKS